MSKFFIFLVGAFFFLVIFRIFLFYTFPQNIADGEKVHFTATVLDDPKVLGKIQHLKIRLGTFWQSVPVDVIVPADKVLSYGDSLEITGTLKYSLLKSRNLIVAIYFPQIKAEKKGFLSIFAIIRQQITIFCEKTFSQPYSGLLAGMILGVKNTLPDSITRSFRVTGVSHVVAASCMNVTLIAGFLLSFLTRFF